MQVIGLVFLAILTMPPDVSKISNKDLKWDGNVVGLIYELDGETAKISREKKDIDPKKLLPLLDDPQRYVAAHILLCEIMGFKGATSSKSYNGLRVKLFGGGRFEYNDDDRLRLTKYWKQRLDDELKQAR